MNFYAWTDEIKATFWDWGTINATPIEQARYIAVLKHIVPRGMTTASNMHLLNCAVKNLDPGECYLEVGTWRGSTLIGALLGNDAYGYAIDNDTMDEHDEGDGRSSKDVCLENLHHFGMLNRTMYIDGSVPGVWRGLDVPPVGVYFFDGDKSTSEAAYDGLSGVLPYLSNMAMIVIDDANEVHIRTAVGKLTREHLGHVYPILDIPTPGNCWPMFWNGVMVLAWANKEKGMRACVCGKMMYPDARYCSACGVRLTALRQV